MNRTYSNLAFSLKRLRNQYDDTSKNSDVYKFLAKVFDTKMFLNLGYSKNILLYIFENRQVKFVDIISQIMLDISRRNNHKIENVLDIACGRGGPSIRFANKFHTPVTGVDISKNNIKIARENAILESKQNLLNFVLADATKLPFKNESFDACRVIESPHIQNKLIMVREANRILKENGIFLIADITLNKNKLKGRKIFRLYQEFLYIWDIPYLNTSDEYLKILRKNGFDIVLVKDVSKYNLKHLRKLSKLFLIISKSSIISSFLKNILYRKDDINLKNLHRTIDNFYALMKEDLISYKLFFCIKKKNNS